MTDQAPRVSRQNKIVLVVIAAAGVIAALWLTLAPNRIAGPTAPDGQRPASSDPREAARAEVPEALALRPDSVAPGTRDAAATLPADAAEAARAIAKARADGLLPTRPIPGAAPGCPRMAGELGDALVKKTPMAASSFELATLLGGVLRTRGAEVEYGLVPKARFSATELLARRFVVRVKGGAWLAPDGEGSEGATALSDTDLIGYVVAFRALGALARNDADVASRAAGLARRLLPDDPAIGFVTAAVEAVGGLADEARRSYDKAAKLGADAMTWYRLGRNARADQRPFKADEHFKQAIALDATFAAPHVELAELALERLDVTPKEEHPALLEAARKAIADAERADPKAAGIRIVKAHLTSLDGKNDEARALLEEETRLHPESETGFVVLANAYAAERKDDEALKTLEAARAKGHETTDVLEGLGTLYANAGRFDDAKKAFAKALDLNPESRTYRLQLAQFERESGNVQKARELLEQQTAKFPDESMGFLLLAQLELASEQPDKAKAAVAKVIARDPHDKDALLLDYLIGVVADKVEAEARKKAVEAIGTRRKLAELLLQNGLSGEAEVVLEEGLTAEPDDVVVPVLLVAIYTVTQRPEEARVLREQTLNKIDPAQRADVEKLFEDAVAQALRAAQPEPLTP